MTGSVFAVTFYMGKWKHISRSHDSFNGLGGGEGRTGAKLGGGWREGLLNMELAGVRLLKANERKHFKFL